MKDPKSPVAPMLLGPANAESAVGAPWRWVRDAASELGVRFVGHGRKRFVVASEFMAALARVASTSVEPAAVAAGPADPAAAVRQALGLTRRTNSPGDGAENTLGLPSTATDCPADRPGRAA
ncbi:MAG: hypothetical protein HYZ29_23435 [Myxococcales bacterium]|nr:hypothetical protein [Myxococcales bacterium]